MWSDCRMSSGRSGFNPRPDNARRCGHERLHLRSDAGPRILGLEERLEMNGECSRCKQPLTVDNASNSVARTGIGRCRSCENEHTKGRSRTLGGRYTLGRSQAKFNNHKWELSFQQYAAIVASGRCFYCGNPLPTAAAGLDRKENEDYTWDTVFPCCGKQPRATGPRGCNETKSHEIAPILLFVRRWYERSGKLPTEQDFVDSVRQFEADRDKAFEIIRKLESGEVKKLKRAKSVAEGLATLSPG